MAENPFAPPATTPRSSQRRTFRKTAQGVAAQFVVGLVTSSSAAVMGYSLTNLVDEHWHGYLLLAVGMFLLTALIAHANWTCRFFELLAGAAGLTWGFLGVLSIIISVQNGRDSVDWPTMIPALVLIPWVASVLVIPSLRKPEEPQ